MIRKNLADRTAIVRPLEVPWMVSPSVSDLHLVFRELDGGRACTLRFDAFLGHHTTGNSIERVEIVFDAAICCRALAFRSDDEMPGGEAYDWTNVFVQPKNEEELRNRLRLQAEQWESSGNCPDPHFYIIEDSPWAGEYGDSFLHFLLTGADGYVEILAQRYRWSIVPEAPHETRKGETRKGDTTRKGE